MYKKLLVCAALAAGLLAVGCGDDEESGDGSATTAATITKEDWIAEANRICRASNEAMEAEAEDFFESGKGSEVDFQREVVVPGIADQVADIKALGAPEGDQNEVDAIIAAAEEGLAQAESDPTTVEGDSGPLADASRLISQYGAKDCA